MDFEEKLKKAIERGHRHSENRGREAATGALSEEELKRLHSKYQIQISDHIEQCLAKVAGHFPGFQFETVVNERGWGAAISRDDFGVATGSGRKNFYSRLEMTVRPFASHHVLELTAKGTVRNKELYNRTHFQPLPEADPDRFKELVDFWCLEYAELYAAKT